MNLQLNDQTSASTDLYSLLCCEHSLFNSRVHEVAVQRLSEIQNTRTSMIINWDKLFENEGLVENEVTTPCQISTKISSDYRYKRYCWTSSGNGGGNTNMWGKVCIRQWSWWNCGSERISMSYNIISSSILFLDTSIAVLYCQCISVNEFLTDLVNGKVFCISIQNTCNFEIIGPSSRLMNLFNNIVSYET